ncbi:MAG: 4-hydroxy-tetrahydrodipicolinate synthase [Lachnospiraceae bacterium]|jgi:4-hydroxy-tetrahydrodipicolinate synthase|nr:4-hydroxy-tetrahydrodipicolinate synthase [Lachnospiraceae bacterium]
MAIFKGAGVAIVTPFHEDGSIHYEKFAQLVEEQIAGGTDAIIVCGTTGESSTLTHEEHLDLIRFCVETVKGRVPVVAGTGSNCTQTAVYLSQEAEKYGADALLLVTPYYNKATQNGLFAHYKKVADSVKLPIILYNVPSRTGCNIQPQTAVRLCTEVENIVGIKEASGNISQVAKLQSLADGKVDVYSGNDDQIVPILSLGGKGVISVLSNVAPRQTHDICQKFFDGDVEGSMQEQLRAIDLCDALFCEVNPIPVKVALNLMGKEVGPARMPLSEMEPQNVERLKKAMQEYGILAKEA